MSAQSRGLLVVDKEIYPGDETFARDVIEGLTQALKSLPCKYFYDEEGSRLFRDISHSFLRERGPDNVPSQVFHRGFFPGMDAGATKNLKPGMSPGFQELNKIGSDFAFSEKLR